MPIVKYQVFVGLVKVIDEWFGCSVVCYMQIAQWSVFLRHQRRSSSERRHFRGLVRQSQHDHGSVLGGSFVLPQ